MNPAPIKIALYEPRIPQNTGCIARTCAAFKIPLILIEPLGFSLEDRYLKRAGLDYWPYVDIKTFPNFQSFRNSQDQSKRLIGFSKSGKVNIHSFLFEPGDILLFGREDNGLPPFMSEHCSFMSSIPMAGAANKIGKGGVRSLNLSVAVGIASYEATKQIMNRSYLTY